MTRRLLLLCTFGIGLPAAATVAILASLPVGTPARQLSGPAAQVSPVAHMVAVIAVLVAAAHLGGEFAHRLRQPRVIGQTLAGIMLGPALLGQFAPEATLWLHAGGVDVVVDLLSNLGVIMFVFLIARELADGNHHGGIRAIVVGQVMVAVPLLGGVLLAVTALAGARPPQTEPVPYTLFIGLAMSATALPVLAHILAERRLLTTRVGALGAASAAFGDATIWCVLAVTLCLAGDGNLTATLLRFVAAVGIAVSVWWGLRPLLRRLLYADRDSPYVGPALVLAGLLGCAFASDALGLHAIFGAFLFGLAVPSRSLIVSRVSVAADGMAHWLLLPLFFTAIGSRFHLELLVDAQALAMCVVVVVVAVTTKLVSAGGAGRILGLTWLESAALGVMVNCRGLTELLVLNIGLGAGILDARTFTVFVLMALLTTAATGPLLDVFLPRRREPVAAPTMARVSA